MQDSLCVGSLMRRNMRFRNHRVDQSCLVTFPWIGPSTEEYHSSSLDTKPLAQGADDSANPGSVTAYNPGRFCAQILLVIALCNERPPSKFVLLSALEDGFHACLVISRLVSSPNPCRST